MLMTESDFYSNRELMRKVTGEELYNNSDEYVSGFLKYIRPPSKKTNWLINEYHGTFVIIRVNKRSVLLMNMKYQSLFEVPFKRNITMYFIPSRAQREREEIRNIIVNKLL